MAISKRVVGVEMVKKKKKMPSGIIIGALALAAAVSVFALLALNNGSAQLTKLRTGVQEIAKGRESVASFLELEVKGAKLSDEEMGIVADFEEMARNCGRIEELRGYAARGGDRAKAIADEAAEAYGAIKDLYEAEQDIAVAFDGEMSDDDWAKVGESKNTFLREMAGELGRYRNDVKALNAENNDFEKAYAELLERGEKLKKKYAQISLKEVIGKESKEVMTFFDKIDELNRYLSERD